MRARLLAGVLDIAILLCVGVVLGFIAVFFPQSDVVEDSVIEGVMEFLAITLGWLYYAIMESSRHLATLGKAPHEGFLIAAFNARAQTPHNMLAGCLVLSRDTGS